MVGMTLTKIVDRALTASGLGIRDWNGLSVKDRWQYIVTMMTDDEVATFEADHEPAKTVIETERLNRQASRWWT